MALSADQKRSVIAAHGSDAQDTGATQAQVALLSANIDELQKHFATHKKDHASRRGLIGMVNRRRKLLNYLKRRNFDQYRELIDKLGLRR